MWADQSRGQFLETRGFFVSKILASFLARLGIAFGATNERFAYDLYAKFQNRG